MEDVIGRCYGETSPTRVSFISKTVPAVNEYVYLEYNGRTIMGIIDDLLRGSFTLSDDLLNPDTIGKITDIESDVDQYVRGEIHILGDLETLELPRIPAPPGTEIKRATISQLDKLFKNNDGIKIGTVLSEPDVDVKIDVNKMVSRHLAILAMTGAGKSNATSVIIDELLSLNATIVVFDMHAEYKKTKFSKGNSKNITPQINPRDLHISEFKKLCNVSEGATNQESYLRQAIKHADKQDALGLCDNYVDEMIKFLKDTYEEIKDDTTVNKSHKDAVKQMEFKIDDMMHKYDAIFNSSTSTSDIINILEIGSVNVICLSSLDEIAADIIVNHVLREILARRKNAEIKGSGKTLDYPVFNIIEEAHILASQKRNTRSKDIIGKIAREGRKFGVGLCLVSQSPKSLDGDALSQVNNLIILRLVEPSDQSHVQKSSESLSEDLLKKLPSLNVGEAIILGQMTKIPTLVKIDEFKGRTLGSDLDIVSKWRKSKINEEKDLKNSEDYIQQMGY